MTEPTDLEAIIAAHQHLEGPMLPILHAVQDAFGHIPPEAPQIIARSLRLTEAEVHGVISFYHDFRNEPAAKHVVKICRSEACQAVGGETLSQRALDKLGTGWGGTSGDVTVEPVYCLGLCACAPAVMVDGKLHGRVDDARLDALLAEVSA